MVRTVQNNIEIKLSHLLNDQRLQGWDENTDTSL